LQLSEESIEQLKKEAEELRGSIRAKEEQLANAQARCSQFEQLSKDIQFSKDRELSMKDAEIERLTSNVAEIESIAVSKEAKLSEEISSLKRSIKAIQSELDEQIRISTDAVKTAEEMTTANMELSKKISSWEEEKNALIERCLNTESDLDFERERAMEIASHKNPVRVCDNCYTEVQNR
ncbi:hypothetical protein OSTOST_19229, partial [Ostertagia ostertagi]